MLANEGIWVEPASAAGLAGIINQFQVNDREFKDKEIVIICTGHGLKDPDVITHAFEKPRIYQADMAALEEVILNV